MTALASASSSVAPLWTSMRIEALVRAIDGKRPLEIQAYHANIVPGNATELSLP